MTYNLQVDLTADPTNLRAGIDAGRDALQGFGEAGRAASIQLDQIPKAIAETGRATEAGSAALAKHRQQLADIAQARSVMAISAAEAERATRAADAALSDEIRSAGQMQIALESLRAKYVPLFAVEQQHAAVLGEIAQAQKIGAISTDEAAAAIERQTAAYNRRRSALTGQIITPEAPPDLLGNFFSRVDFGEFEGAVDGLRARFVPLYAIERQHQAVLGEIDRAQRLGAISVNEATASIERQTAAYERQRAAVARQLAAPDLVGNFFGRVDFGEFEAAVDGLRAKFVPLHAIERQHQAVLGEIDRAQRLGAISANEATASIERQTAAYERQRAAVARQLAAPDLVGNFFGRVDFGEFEAAVDGLRAKFVPLHAIERQHQAVLGEIDRAQRLGAISTDEATASIERQTVAYNRQRQALAGLRSTGAGRQLTAQDRTMLAYQANDVLVSLAGGMNPLMVALQQGSQITPIFGGVRGTAQAAIQWLTPMRAAIGGVAAAAGIGAVALNDFVKSTKDVDLAMAVAGDRVGATRAELDALAQAGADAGGVSMEQARALQATLIRAGGVQVQLYDDLIAVSRDFAATLDSDLESANQKLAEIISSPAQGAETARSLGLIDAATARHVQQLAAWGRSAEAQKVLLEEIRKRLVDAGEATTWFGRRLQDLGNVGSTVLEEIGSRLGGLWDRATGNMDRTSVIAGLMSDSQVELAAVEEEIRYQQGAGLPFAEGRLITLEARAERLRADIERHQRALSVAAEAAREQGQLSDDRERIARSAELSSQAPGVQEEEALIRMSQRRAQLARDLSSGLVPPERLRAMTRELAELDWAVGGYISSQDKALALNELDIRLMRERDPIRRADIEAERVRIELSGTMITQEEVEARAIAARNRALAESSIAIGREVEALDQQARAQLAVARAYGESEAAGLRAAARRDAGQAALAGGIDVDGRARQILAGQVADAGAEAARSAAGMEAAAEAQARLNDEVARGTRSYEDAARALQVEQALHELSVLQQVAEGQLREELTAIIDRLRFAYQRLNAEQGRTAGLGIIQQQRESIAAAQLELSSLGLSGQERARLVATMEAEQRIRAEGLDANSAEAAQIRRNALAIAELNIEIDHQGEIYQDLRDAGRQAFNDLNEMIATNQLSWKSLEDVATGVIQNINRALLNQATAPLQSGLDGLIGSLAGSLGSMFGGGSSAIAAADVASMPIFHAGGITGEPARETRRVPLSAWAGAPRYHGGGILPGEQAVITRSGEGIFTPQQMDNADRLFQALASRPAGGVTNIIISDQVGVRAQETGRRRNQSGGEDIEVLLQRQQGAALSDPSSAPGAALSSTWGAQPSLIGRG